MNPSELARLIVDAIRDKKGEDILILDVEALVGYASHFVICSAKNARQVHAIADHVVRQLRTANGYRPLGIEGKDGQAKWVLVDYGDLVVHVFREDERAFYDLEGLWQDAPRMVVPEAAPGATPKTA